MYILKARLYTQVYRAFYDENLKLHQTEFVGVIQQFFKCKPISVAQTKLN